MSGAYPSLTGSNPKRRVILQNVENEFWDVRIWPYIVSRDDPVIFAAISYFSVHLYQLTNEEESGVRLLRKWTKPTKEKEEWINTCTFCYVDEHVPLLAVAGESGHVLVINVWSGELVSTLVGHSVNTVNDMKTHPKYPWIIATASVDCSIRIWDLRRANDPTLSTTVIIVGGANVHSAGILSLDWHASGRYIVSGGMDYKVCVWALPDLDPDLGNDFWKSISREQRKRSRDEVKMIYWPHFASTAIHNFLVDSITFIGDMVLSKAAGSNKLVLWSITGFHGEIPPPPEITAVKAKQHLETTNGFMRRNDLEIDDDFFDPSSLSTEGPELYKRCLQLDNPDSTYFYMRFGVARPSKLFPEVHFIVTAADTNSKIRHWDLQSFIDGHNGLIPLPNRKKPGPKPAAVRKGIAQLARTASSRMRARPEKQLQEDLDKESSRDPSTDRDNLTSEMTPSTRDTTPQTNIDPGQIPVDRTQYPLHLPEKCLPAHRQHNEKKDFSGQFRARGIAWSPCGMWCVCAGELAKSGYQMRGGIVVYYRGREVGKVE